MATKSREFGKDKGTKKQQGGNELQPDRSDRESGQPVQLEPDEQGGQQQEQGGQDIRPDVNR